MIGGSILVTGGSGFIGKNFILSIASEFNCHIVNLDSLTYAACDVDASKMDDLNYQFVHGSITDKKLLIELFSRYKFSAIINFAAESHVDRSIEDPFKFIHTNVVGTYTLLEVAKDFYMQLDKSNQENFRFIHISTDEVYGSLKPDDLPFEESSPFKPNSPYSASKASSDHFVRAYFKTYGLPLITTNCSNNYGPYQHPEKLIPKIIRNALLKQPLPIYGDGQQIRDWLYVEDHCSAIKHVLQNGAIGCTYNIGGNNEYSNIELVNIICDFLDHYLPMEENSSYSQLIEFVKDRPGHDLRYAINSNKIQKHLNWKPQTLFHDGIIKTVKWYIDNKDWLLNFKKI